MSLAVDHVNLVVTDMERALAFYCEVLGLERGFERTLTGDWVDRVTGQTGVVARCVFLTSPAGGVHLELLQFETPTGTPLAANSLPCTPGLRHVAFTVDNLDELCARLRSAGHPPISDSITVPFPVAGHGRKRLCYFRDPEGVLLEAAQYEAAG